MYLAAPPTRITLRTNKEHTMDNKDFLRQRINVYAKMEVDPSVDEEVVSMLKRKFNVYLPQRRSLDESLSAAKSDHEIIELILEYRKL
ncbi:hypothetical protein KO528_04300 [Saccharophagus degradans]|nr:hypothetical protein [Saccharophagus degradans]